MKRYILPIAPKPQSRPRFGNGRTYEPSEMTQWKREVSQMLKQLKARIVSEGTIFVSVTFYIYPTKSISKINTKRPRANEELEKTFVAKRPDLDNYVKAFYDASNGILFKDDGQIAVESNQKLYSLNPRIEFEIEKLEETK